MQVNGGEFGKAFLGKGGGGGWRIASRGDDETVERARGGDHAGTVARKCDIRAKARVSREFWQCGGELAGVAPDHEEGASLLRQTARAGKTNARRGADDEVGWRFRLHGSWFKARGWAFGALSPSEAGDGKIRAGDADPRGVITIQLGEWR